MDYKDNIGDQRSQDNGSVPRSINQLGVVASQPANDNNVFTSVEDGKSPLGLQLTLDDRFLNLMTKILKQKYNPNTKAVTFSALSLQIGNWKKTSMTDSDLKCKIYPRRNYLAWEIMIDGEKRKNKIHVNFEDIDEMNVGIPPNNDSKGSLTLKLKDSPSFFVEKPPKRKQHTDWDKIELDFTDNQASSLCSHILEVKSGVLEKHISTILTADPTNKPTEDKVGNKNDAIQPFNVSIDPPQPNLDATFTMVLPQIDDYMQEQAPPPQAAVSRPTNNSLEPHLTAFISDAENRWKSMRDPNMNDYMRYQVPYEGIKKYGINQNDAGWQFDSSIPRLLVNDPSQPPLINATETSSIGLRNPWMNNNMMEDAPLQDGVNAPSLIDDNPQQRLSSNDYDYYSRMGHEASSSGVGWPSSSNDYYNYSGMVHEASSSGVGRPSSSNDYYTTSGYI